jgi:glycosyltransferase involved in cell wall biosynthesis
VGPEASGCERTWRSLFVSDERVWPPVSGYRRRTLQILTALTGLGPLTWVAAPRNRFDDRSPLELPPQLAGADVEARLVVAGTRGRAATMLRWLTSRLSWPLAAGDWTAVDRVLERHQPTGFDLIWCMGLDALLAVERAGLGAPVVIVDADLESLKLARQIELGAVLSPLRALTARLDVGRWGRLETEAAERVSGFSVCSEQERDRLGGAAFVTPNSYGLVDDPADPGAWTPTLLFVGALGYQPNREGLEWFVTEVLPLVRQGHPEARLRVVGSGPELGAGLGRVDGVELVGAVDDIGSELRRAAAAVVPIQWGAGTRIKILEALAHRVPVVSTTLGAEGLALIDGQHIRLVDDPSAFAQACLWALERTPAVDAVVERGHRAFLENYEQVVVTHGLQRHVRRLLEEADDAGPPRGRPRPARRRRRGRRSY